MELLTPDTRRILSRFSSDAPADDRAPDSLAAGTSPRLHAELGALVGEDRLLTRVSDLVRYASDASPYRMFPQVVVQPQTAREVALLLGYASRTRTPATFRSGGTSLNGQGQGDGILLDVRRHWHGVRVEEGGQIARLKPGTPLGYANRVLARFGRRLGPDPASSDIATVGGVVANNSGGMRCGTTQDSYSTLRSMTFVLPSGTQIDTAAPDAAERFAAAEPTLAAGLIEIRDELRADVELSARVRRKFAIKNTTGYRLSAFLDADEPVEIFRRLLIGSEGTLAFLAEAVFETVPVKPCTSISWVHLASIDAAMEPVADLVAAGATAVELMVAPALMVASHSIPGTPESWRELPLDSAALLVEFAADDDAELGAYIADAETILARHDLLAPTAFTHDHDAIELAWTVREGLHGLVGRLREPGSSLMLEDVCVPPARLADFATDLQTLLGKHGFLTGVAGHASAGNLHFMLTPQLGDAADRDRYDAFMADLVDLVLDGYDGSLKAEHGTGFNMAPFVKREWGAKATNMMWRVKALADPAGILGPGVVLNRDPHVHLRNLKTTPPIEEVATSCVECGFCEPVCPSRNLTTTPRQRIVLRREMERQAPGSPVQLALLEQFEYDGLQTCAADGICQTVCPLGIDTGKLVKELRAREHTPRAQKLARAAAKRREKLEGAARAGLSLGGAIGDGPMRLAAGAVRAIVSDELVPSWPEGMPPAAPRTLPLTQRAGAAAVYLPACINRIFGAADGGVTLPQALVEVSARAGKPLWIPPDVGGHCCGTPWHSKGYTDGHADVVAELAEALVRWTDGGALPLVIDATSCTLGVIEDVQGTIEEARRPDVLDSIAWAHDELLPGLNVRRTVRRAAVHPPCSSRHLGLAGKLEAITRALADEVDVPISATCCGFAGDRGMLHPELPAAALAPEAAELAGARRDAAVCSNRTCEIGLLQATGEPFSSFVHLLDEATRP